MSGLQPGHAGSECLIRPASRCLLSLSLCWLDSGEVERFAHRPPLDKPHGLPDKAQEILGNALIQQIELKAETESAAETFRNYARLDVMSGSPIGYLAWLLWRLRK